MSDEDRPKCPNCGGNMYWNPMWKEWDCMHCTMTALGLNPD